MNKKQKLGCLAAVLTVCLSLPIGFYLQYQILLRIQATEVMWLLFFTNIPIVFLSSLLIRLGESLYNDDEN